MSWIMHDLRCLCCEAIERGVLVDREEARAGRWPACPCRGERTWLPAGLHTDAYGHAQMSDASGQSHTSQREKDAHMRRMGFEPSGDKVGGARNELRLHGSAFSYSGQGARTSTGERFTKDPVQGW